MCTMLKEGLATISRDAALEPKCWSDMDVYLVEGASASWQKRPLAGYIYIYMHGPKMLTPATLPLSFSQSILAKLHEIMDMEAVEVWINDIDVWWGEW